MSKRADLTAWEEHFIPTTPCVSLGSCNIDPHDRGKFRTEQNTAGFVRCGRHLCSRTYYANQERWDQCAVPFILSFADMLSPEWLVRAELDTGFSARRSRLHRRRITRFETIAVIHNLSEADGHEVHRLMRACMQRGVAGAIIGPTNWRLAGCCQMPALQLQAMAVVLDRTPVIPDR